MQRRPGDSAKLRDRNERSQAPQVHRALSPICINSQKNYVLDVSLARLISSAQASVDMYQRWHGDPSFQRDEVGPMWPSGSWQEAIMTSAFSPWRPRRQVASGWLTSSVLFIGLLTAVPCANADTIPDWNLVTANALQTAKAGT